MNFNLDVERNSNILKISKELYLKILGKAITQTEQDLHNVEAALPLDQFATIEAVTHRWKGDFDNLRVTALSDLAKQMNQLARLNQDKEKIVELLNQFREYFVDLSQFVSNRKQ